MPNEFQDAGYELARNKRRTNPLKRSPVLPPSDKRTITPSYLLQHENHFDPNVITPEDMQKKLGIPHGEDRRPIERA